jgi:integrase
VLGFCHWLNLNGYVTNVEVKLKTWVANFKSDDMLNYIQRKEQNKIDSSTIRVLDKERRQKRLKSLILTEEIRELIDAFSDPVYAEMFRLSLGTALRPSELCNFPYYGTGRNSHIMPYSSMYKNGKTVEYTTVGKGNKVRTIKVNIKDLESLERNYIKPYYRERAKKFEKHFGHAPPLSLLFLNKKGMPITASSIAVRTNAAKRKAIQKNSSFRDSISFYDARHWWPTQFLITFFGDRLLTETTDVLFAACAEVLKNQLGHDSLETTYKHYIDLSRVVLMAHGGMVNEVVSERGESVEEFITRLNLKEAIPVKVEDDE